MQKGRVLVTAALVSAAMALRADQPVAPAGRIGRATAPITIDGDLSDPGWSSALRFDTWYETNPGDNVPPKVKTVGYVTFDDHFLYIGLDMPDPNPSQIKAMFGDHDQINGNADDFGGVILDTRNDGKTGYEFFVNAHGTQYDAVQDDTSGNEDPSPDFFWDSATKIDAHGWSLELRIPFTSLRYSSSNPAEWGLMLYRNYPRERRYQIFTSRLPRGGNCFVCHFGKFNGLQNLPPGGHLVTAPYVTARQLGETRDGIGTPFLNQPVKPGGGGDLKWTPNADTALDATINPDFSQVESDVAAITANERFAVFFPEKRPFFLEDVELFSTPIQAAYTRTITSPRWGLRTTGKAGDNAYTLLVAQDRGGGSVIIPSATGSAFANQDFSSIDAIGRVRHDFGQSFASFLVTDKESRGGSYNRVLGPDFQWRSGNNTITGQLLVSDTRTPNQPDLATEWDGRRLTSHAGYIWYQYQARTNDLYTEYKDYGNGFRAENGFVPQAGYRSNFAEAGHTWWPKEGFFSRVRAFTQAQYDSEQDGSQLYRFNSIGFGADGKYRSFIRFRLAEDRVRSGDDLFTRHQFFYTVQFAVNRVLSNVSLDGWLGQDVDFSNSRLGQGAKVTLGGTVRPTDHLEIALTSGVRWLDENLTGQSDRLFTSQIERIKATYTFNSRMFVRAIVQNQRTNNDQAMYIDAVDHIDGSLATQLLVAYKINWQTLLYVGVGDLRQATLDQGNLEPSSRQFFFKVSYAFQR
jgi:Domain of unknown function (DUF5916)